MADTAYNYVKNVDPSQLTEEIQASAIATPLVRIDTTGKGASMNVAVWFSDPLSAGDETTLDGIVAAHVPVLLFRELQVWEDNPAQSTILETWQSAMSRTSQPLTAGAYMLGWYAEFRLDPVGPINSRAAVRFSIDGNVKSNNVTELDQFVGFTGWDRYVASDGDEPVLEIEFRRDPGEGGNDRVEVRKLKLKIEVIRR